jgi:hypothetical protein
MSTWINNRLRPEVFCTFALLSITDMRKNGPNIRKGPIADIPTFRPRVANPRFEAGW